MEWCTDVRDQLVDQLVLVAMGRSTVDAPDLSIGFKATGLVGDAWLIGKK